MWMSVICFLHIVSCFTPSAFIRQLARRVQRWCCTTTNPPTLQQNMLARSCLRVMAAASVEGPRPIATSMQKKLETLSPAHLKIINESYKHAGHSGNPTGAADAETHFRVEIVSDEFKGKRLVQRHQLMYKLLDDEIKAGVHALSMDTKTPEEAGMQ